MLEINRTYLICFNPNEIPFINDGRLYFHNSFWQPVQDVGGDGAPPYFLAMPFQQDSRRGIGWVRGADTNHTLIRWPLQNDEHSRPQIYPKPLVRAVHNLIPQLVGASLGMVTANGVENLAPIQSLQPIRYTYSTFHRFQSEITSISIECIHTENPRNFHTFGHDVFIDGITNDKDRIYGRVTQEFHPSRAFDISEITTSLFRLREIEHSEAEVYSIAVKKRLPTEINHVYIDGKEFTIIFRAYDLSLIHI